MFDQTNPHHLHHLHLRLDSQLIEEHGQILLHLDTVVIHLCDCEDSHLTLPPHLQHKQNMLVLKTHVKYSVSVKVTPHSYRTKD